MKKIYLLALSLTTLLFSCEDWLERTPKDIITDPDVYASEGMVNSVVAGLYNRLPDIGAIHQDPAYYTQLDEGMLGQNVNNFISFPLDYWRYYDYVLIRDINYHLNRVKSSVLSPEEIRYYVAEARFLRAYVYFELVKRMGGVPLITETMSYDPDADVTTYQVPRARESEIYDFIAKEVDEIKEDLNLTPLVQYNRASKGGALALKCRAMLYAGSLAKYNSSMTIPVTLEGSEVGIPASKANEYFTASLNAAKELIAMNVYKLYDANINKSDNFKEALIKSWDEGNNEIIFIKAFVAPANLHDWTYNNLPRTLREGGFSGLGGTYINPSLNLVDAYEMIDGTSGKLIPYTNPDHADETVDDSRLDGSPDAYVYYDNLSDIFIGKDPRLAGTVILPGSRFGSNDLDIKAGIAYYNESTGKFSFQSGSLENESNNIFTIDKVPVEEDNKVITKTGSDGPSASTYVSRTGFYVRKSMDEKPAGSAKASAVQFVRYRYGEVLLNAAEAAFELGLPEALGYLKQVRDRAGIQTPSSINLELIRNERRVELAFEGHRFYDLKRWRTADILFDGNINTSSAMIYGLYPFKVYRPDHETHNKWIYVRRIPTPFTAPRKFVWANYYSSFSGDVLTKNPKLVKNPGQ